MFSPSFFSFFFFFFFNDTATTEIYTLSLHDALPICSPPWARPARPCWPRLPTRSEEHTSELQSRGHLVCRLLLEKKKKPNPSSFRWSLEQAGCAPEEAIMVG